MECRRAAPALLLRDLAAARCPGRDVRSRAPGLLLERFWLNAYAPEVIAVEAGRYPSIEAITHALGGGEVVSMPIPLECTDGFGEAYYGRPERLLDPGARLANSAWSFVGQDVHDRFTQQLTRDLADGKWDAEYGHLREQPFFEGSLVMLVSVRADKVT